MDDHTASPRRSVPVTWVAGLVAAALGVVLVLHAAPWLAAPFGNSHDGRNASVWGASARGLREDPLASHLGGINLAGEPYATHPPGIVVAAAATSTLVGDRPLSFRLPAVLASLATLGILAGLLVRMGFGRVATAVALVLCGTSVMFLVYGTMLDTPMLGLPLSAAVLYVASGVQRGRPPARWVVVGVGAACGLVSWQAGLTAAVAGVLLLIEPAARPARTRLVAALLGGLAAGLLLTVAWAWWAYGDLGAVMEAFGRRTGSQRGWWQAQRDVVGYAYGPARLAVVALGGLVALARRRHRLVLATAVSTPVIWGVAFREGATVHDYWLYSGVLAVAVGAAVVVEALVEGAHRFVPRLEPVAIGVVCLLTGLSAGVALAERSPPEDALRAGIEWGRLAAEVPEAARADQVVVFVGPYGPSLPAGWAAWSSGGVVAPIDAGSLRQLGRSDPDALVLVNYDPGGATGEEAAAQTVASNGAIRLVRAELFADSEG